jgi:hypothetical protein
MENKSRFFIPNYEPYDFVYLFSRGAIIGISSTSDSSYPNIMIGYICIQHSKLRFPSSPIYKWQSFPWR